jgi:NADPH-ferrihemoprotein reductase
MSDFEPGTLAGLPSTKLAIFIVSTYGEGEPSDNLGELWNWLGSTKNEPLSQLKYAAFGLGNSNYKYYNAVVDYVTTSLESLGARQLLETGRVDDSQGQTEEHYLEWKAALFGMLKTTLAYEEHEPVYEPTVEVYEDDTTMSSEVYDGKPWIPSQSRPNRAISPTHSLPIKVASELFTVTEDRNCIHMELDLSEQFGLKYKTGDHLGIWPTNPTGEVSRLLRCLGWKDKRQATFKIKELEQCAKPKVPERTTLDALLTNYVEICAPVTRELIGSLVQFAPTSEARDLLGKLSTDKAAYDDLLRTTYINLGRLLELAAPEAGAWENVPLSFIIEMLPTMRPRYYSISSSSVVQPRRVAVTAVVADKLLPSPNQRVPGLCTNYLRARKMYLCSNSAQESTRLLAHVRKSTFKLPTLSSHPIVMTAAGTGIAPFRAFLQERARLFKMGRPIGRMILFFGCRNANQDFLYRDELRDFQTIFGSKLTMVTAFSRPDDGLKMYVQDRVAEHSQELTELLVDCDANFYICGSAAMARDVSRAVGVALSDGQKWNEGEVQSFMERQKKSRRWQQDVWG